MRAGAKIKPIISADGKEYYVLWCSPFQSDVLAVLQQFEGRDRRRIKRELRKLSQRGNVRH